MAGGRVPRRERARQGDFETLRQGDSTNQQQYDEGNTMSREQRAESGEQGAWRRVICAVDGGGAENGRDGTDARDGTFEDLISDVLTSGTEGGGL